MPLSSALHMSYTVRAATDAATSASISTPVTAVVRASVRIAMPSVLTSALDLDFAQRNRWHMGISSDVRLAARIPATRATSSGSPLGFCGKARRTLRLMATKRWPRLRAALGSCPTHPPSTPGRRRHSATASSAFLALGHALITTVAPSSPRPRQTAPGQEVPQCSSSSVRPPSGRPNPASAPLDLGPLMRAAELRRQKPRQPGLGGELRLQAQLARTAAAAASLRPARPAPAAQTAETSPWSKPDCPASQKMASSFASTVTSPKTTGLPG